MEGLINLGETSSIEWLNYFLSFLNFIQILEQEQSSWEEPMNQFLLNDLICWSLSLGSTFKVKKVKFHSLVKLNVSYVI